MKYAILLLGLSSAAFGQQAIQNVHEVALTTNTITQTIQLGTVTDVAAATSSGTLKGAFAIEVYNVAASSKTIVCGFDQNLSTAPYGTWYGREIPAGIGVYYGVGSNRKVYCGSQINLPGTTPVTITQFK